MRNKLSAFIQFVTPIINITLSVFVSRSWKFLSSLPPLTLSLESGFRYTESLLSRSPNITEGSFEANSLRAYKDYFESLNDHQRLTDLRTTNLGNFYLNMVIIQFLQLKITIYHLRMYYQVLVCFFLNFLSIQRLTGRAPLLALIFYRKFRYFNNYS